MTYDCIIIGAGVAGLAAARTLREAGANIMVVEARERIGGRIFTVQDLRCAIPIELGAEFLHGTADETMDIVRAARLQAVDVDGEHWRARNGRLRKVENFWHDIDLVLRRIDHDQPDESFLEFLGRKPGGQRLARERKLALEFVQGFHASDPARISTHALAEGGSPGDDPGEQRQSRILDGYESVPQVLAAGCWEQIELGIIVSRVEWERDAVTVRARDGRRFDARRVIITVPLGVLQSSAFVIQPTIPNVERAARLLAMGEVLRVALLFDEPFWEDRGDIAGGASLANLSFVHAIEQSIPVWWSAYPVRTPLLVGWAGGTQARLLSGSSPDELRDIAIATVANNFGMKARTVSKKLLGFWTHDWQRDPYSRGAYSYATVGGAAASALLARPAKSTVYLAGEAASTEGRNGTVDGAIASGQEAARRVLRSL